MDDRLVFDPEKTLARAQQLISDTQAKLISDASHCLPMEQPARVTARVLTFLDAAHSSIARIQGLLILIVEQLFDGTTTSRAQCQE